MSDEMARWPRYQSHKIVRARKIIEIETMSVGMQPRLFVQAMDSNDKVEFKPTEPGMASRARLGSYAVAYEDGFLSVSPADVFEAGYQPIQP